MGVIYRLGQFSCVLLILGGVLFFLVGAVNLANARKATENRNIDWNSGSEGVIIAASPDPSHPGANDQAENLTRVDDEKNLAIQVVGGAALVVLLGLSGFVILTSKHRGRTRR